MKPRYPVASGLLLLVLGSLILTGCPYGPFSPQRLDELHVSGTVTVNDPLYEDQAWYLEAINAPQAWFFLQTLESLFAVPGGNVVVMDTNFDLTHEDMSGVFGSGGFDFLRRSTALLAPKNNRSDGHGTHVAGLAGAVGGNGVGIAGAGFNLHDRRTTQIIPLVVLDSDGGGNVGTVVEALFYSADLARQRRNGSTPVRVVNMSLGSSDQSGANFFTEAVTAVADADVVMVAAAGNEVRKGVNGCDNSSICPRNYLDLPARLPEVISVGAVGKDCNGLFVHSRFSSYSAPNGTAKPQYFLDLVAPGGELCTKTDGEETKSTLMSTVPFNQYNDIQGTSMAAPLVSAVASLIRSVNPSLSAVQVRTILTETARKVWQEVGHPHREFQGTTWDEWHPKYGYGMVDMDRALRRAREVHGTGRIASTDYPIQKNVHTIPPWDSRGMQRIVALIDLSELELPDDLDPVSYLQANIGVPITPTLSDRLISITVPDGFAGQELLDTLNQLPGVRWAAQDQAVSFQ